MKKFALIVLGLLFFAPQARAATFDVSGWIPYWRAASGTAETLQHLDQLTEINPFGYTVKSNGQLVDTAELTKEPWLTLFATARAKKVRIVPTIMWGDGAAIDTVLRNPVLRSAEIMNIVDLVRKQNFDGIDIDYEAKSSMTKDYFSAFLRELYAAMGNKFVDCDIEARTPVLDRYDNVPDNYNPADVANDYVAINKYCDRVRIMAYDQGTVDLALSRTHLGPYIPVSDPIWAERVVKEALKVISPKKIVLGIPTYGYEYAISIGGTTGYNYKLKWAFNIKYALDIMRSLGSTPQRTVADEPSFIYATSSEVRILTWSDAKSIQDKVNLAHKLGLKGIAIFKFDGGADPAMWDVLK